MQINVVYCRLVTTTLMPGVCRVNATQHCQTLWVTVVTRLPDIVTAIQVSAERCAKSVNRASTSTRLLAVHVSTKHSNNTHRQLGGA
jgi:hypothetical protein